VPESLSVSEMLICIAVAGWLASLAVEGYGLGIVGNTALGAIGAALAALGIAGLGAHIEDRTIWVLAVMLGAMVVLSFVSLLRRL
jgi:uncharacterized membrane protein YeaQ/YmgE (transglycosylase-associated protein family)